MKLSIALFQLFLKVTINLREKGNQSILENFSGGAVSLNQLPTMTHFHVLMMILQHVQESVHSLSICDVFSHQLVNLVLTLFQSERLPQLR